MDETWVSSHTPTAIVILAIIKREDEGVTSQPEYTFSKPSNCPHPASHSRDDYARN